MSHQVFLGGACGTTNWRRAIAIPILEAAGINYFNPQLAEGEWTPAFQYTEMEAKDAADVWLFVINEQTRGIASVGEVSYRIGQNRKLALCLTELPYPTSFEGHLLSNAEVDDLNRGRVFVQAMAKAHNVPIFNTVEKASHYAVELAKHAQNELSIQRLLAILSQVETGSHRFLVERLADQFTVKISIQVQNVISGEIETMHGRKWLISPEATEEEVVRTLLKAILTWEEHEAREHFLYKGKRLFDPHFKF